MMQARLGAGAGLQTHFSVQPNSLPSPLPAPQISIHFLPCANPAALSLGMCCALNSECSAPYPQPWHLSGKVSSVEGPFP